MTSDSAIYEFVCSSFEQAPESCFDSYKAWINFKNGKHSLRRKTCENLFVFLPLLLQLINHDLLFCACKTLAKKSPTEESSAWSFFLLIVLGILIFMVTVLLCYRRMLKTEMKSEIGAQVNNAISNYFALNDTNSSSKK